MRRFVKPVQSVEPEMLAVSKSTWLFAFSSHETVGVHYDSGAQQIGVHFLGNAGALAGEKRHHGSQRCHRPSGVVTRRQTAEEHWRQAIAALGALKSCYCLGQGVNTGPMSVRASPAICGNVCLDEVGVDFRQLFT